MLHTVDEKRRLSKKIEDRLNASPEVRPFPAAVTQLASACQDPNADGKKFESIIECDAALAGRILRMANSPLFCPSGTVKSVPHAVALLGLRKLKSVAMSVAGAAMFSSGDQAAAQRQGLWSHSVGCAVVARCLAERVSGVDKDEAFLAGVFHDVGKLLFYDTIPEEYSDVDNSHVGSRLVEEEEFLFGTSHEQVGLVSAESWELPEEISTAIRWHHQPDQAETCAPYATLIHVADGLAKEWAIGSTTPHESEILEKATEEYSLTVQELAKIEIAAQDAYNETMAASAS